MAKTKVMKWKEFDRKFSGLARRMYDRKDATLKPSNPLAHEFAYVVVYNPKKDCTYYGLVDLGIIGLFGPSDDDPILIVRVPGKPVDEWYGKQENKLYFEEILKIAEEHQKKSE